MNKSEYLDRRVVTFNRHVMQKEFAQRHIWYSSGSRVSLSHSIETYGLVAFFDTKIFIFQITPLNGTVLQRISIVRVYLLFFAREINWLSSRLETFLLTRWFLFNDLFVLISLFFSFCLRIYHGGSKLQLCWKDKRCCQFVPLFASRYCWGCMPEIGHGHAFSQRA